MKNVETADTEITFYGFEVIFNATEYVLIFVKKRLPDVFLSAFCLSGFCSEFSKKRCPLSVCPAGQGHRKSGQVCLVLVRQQRISIFRKFRTESGQKDIEQTFFYKNPGIFYCIKNNLITIESNLRVRGLQIFDVHVRVRDSEKFPF